jgi:transposase
MGTKKGRRSHSREFKGDAVRLVTDKGVAVSQVALELGVHENTIYKWLRQYQADPAGAFPGKGNLKPQDEELRRLQRENDILKEEREILKKALAIFSKHRA